MGAEGRDADRRRPRPRVRRGRRRRWSWTSRPTTSSPRASPAIARSCCSTSTPSPARPGARRRGCSSGCKIREVAACPRNPARSVRGDRLPRIGRHGRRLHRARHAPWPHRRDQSPVGRTVLLPRRARPPEARGAHAVAALAPAHLRALRRRRAGGHRLPRDGGAGRRDARGAPRQRGAAVRTGRHARDRHRPRPRCRAPPRHRPPRSQARQRDADAHRRQAARFRARETGRAAGAGQRCGFDRLLQTRHDRRGQHPRHHSVHGARAAGGAPRRCAERSLRVRRDPVRNGHRPARVRRRERCRDRLGDHGGRSAGRVLAAAGRAGRVRSARPGVPRQGSRRALAVGPRRRAAAAVDRGIGSPGAVAVTTVSRGRPLGAVDHRGCRGRPVPHARRLAAAAGSGAAARDHLQHSAAARPILHVRRERRDGGVARRDDGRLRRVRCRRPSRLAASARGRRRHAAARHRGRRVGVLVSRRQVPRVLRRRQTETHRLAGDDGGRPVPDLELESVTPARGGAMAGSCSRRSAAGSSIMAVSSAGGTPVEERKADSSQGEQRLQFPHFLPDGRHVPVSRPRPRTLADG